MITHNAYGNQAIKNAAIIANTISVMFRSLRRLIAVCLSVSPSVATSLDNAFTLRTFTMDVTVMTKTGRAKPIIRSDHKYDNEDQLRDSISS